MRIPDSPPIIKPLPAGVPRPKWSVMIPVYNCAKYLPELLNSLLVQVLNEEQMQIEVIDDFSTDADVEKLVKEIGKGRVAYFRQEENVGSLRNFETCINRSRGEYVHILHGDDRLRPNFYSEMTRLFELYPEAGAGYCNHHYIDAQGNLRYPREDGEEDPYILENWLETLAERNRPQYVAMVVKRSVYEHLGGFYGVVYGEDWEMWARIAKNYPVAYHPKLLAEYRYHDESISGTFYRTGKNIEDISKVIDIINTYLPEKKRRKLKYKARKNYAYYALARKTFLWEKYHINNGGLHYFNAILKMHKDPLLLAKVLKLATRISLYNLKKMISIQKNK